MTTTLHQFLAQVDYVIVADEDELSVVARNAMVKAAIERYSRDKPEEITVDVSGDAGKYYAVATSMTSWSEGFSRVLSIQYPAPTVASDEAPVYLDPEDWNDNYFDGATRYLYLPNHAPAATEAMRIRYSAPYLDTASVYSTPPNDFYAICNLAAGLCAQAIADKYSRTSDSTIAVDSVNHLSRAQEWSRRARALMELYADHLGISGDGDGTISQAAGDFVDWDTAPGWPGGRQWLYHGRDSR